MPRKRYKKVTTVTKDIFGNRRIETQWVPAGSGCGALIVLILLFIFLSRGCS